MTMIRRSYFAKTFISACLFLLAAQAASAKTYNFNGPGSWTDPALWSPSYPGTTINSGDTVSINADSDCAIALDTAVSVNPGATLEINSSGNLTNAGSLFIGGTLILKGSLYNGGGLLTIRGPLNNYDSLSGSGRLAISAEGIAELNNGPLNNPSANSIGQKKLLFIRANFPDDLGGALPTSVNLNSNASTANADFLIASFGLFSLNWTIGPVVTLPHTTAYYNANPPRTTNVLADAHALAASLGYDYTNYDIDIVYIPQFYGIFTSYQGSNVGRAAYSWLEPANILNQAYGVEGFIDDFYFPMGSRADAWYSGDNSVFGTHGSVVPNGDPYDTFGAESAGANYSIYHKNFVGWLPSANIWPVTTSGTYRIYAHDAETSVSNGRYYGLTVAGYQGRTYWIEYRQNPLSGLPGLLINWGGVTLLDMTPGSAGGFVDAPLLIGQTFTDPNGVRINPTATGGTTPRYVDITVTIPGGPTPTPTPPPPPPTPTPTPGLGPPVGSRVTMDLDGVFVRSGPSINYGVVGTQGTASRGTMDQPCLNDPASPRVFCHVAFDAGVSGWVTVEHLVVLSSPSPTPTPPPTPTPTPPPPPPTPTPTPPPTPTPTPPPGPKPSPSPSPTPTPTPPPPPPTPTPSPTPKPPPMSPVTSTSRLGARIENRVTVNVSRVLGRSGPLMNYGVVGAPDRVSLDVVDQLCLPDPASLRVFSHGAFDAGVSSWLTVEHLIALRAEILVSAYHFSSA